MLNPFEDEELATEEADLVPEKAKTACWSDDSQTEDDVAQPEDDESAELQLGIAKVNVVKTMNLNVKMCFDKDCNGRVEYIEGTVCVICVQCGGRNCLDCEVSIKSGRDHC